MTVHEMNEFDQLFVAYANRDVTAEERDRLRQLAGQDVARRGALAEVQALHELFDREVTTRNAVMAPVEAAEEADEGYQRLARAAASAERSLRARLTGPNLRALPGAPKTRTRWGRILVAVAAILVIGAIVGVLANRGAAPALDTNRPASDVLGGFDVSVTTRISEDSPRLSWSEIRGAALYQVSILDASGRVLMQRAEGRLTDWQLSKNDLYSLRAQEGGAFVRVVVTDQDGRELARTKQPRRIEFD